MTAEFEKSAADVKNLNRKPSGDEQLQLYSLYKIATGSDFKKATKPEPPTGMFAKLNHEAIAADRKYKAWESAHNQGITKPAAEKQYTELVGKLKQKYGFKG